MQNGREVICVIPVRKETGSGASPRRGWGIMYLYDQQTAKTTALE